MPNDSPLRHIKKLRHCPEADAPPKRPISTLVPANSQVRSGTTTSR